MLDHSALSPNHFYMNATKRPAHAPTVITFASSKGGVGKSTCSAAIAGALAARGDKVTILDLDDNGTLFRWHQKHGAKLRNIAVTRAAPDTFNDTLNQAKATDARYIIIDVAGAFEATMIKAIAASTVVITPAKLSEPDLREAGKILAEVNAFNQRFNADIQHRVLINEAESLNPMYQRHALAEVDASALVRFEHLMNRRAPYREIFITGYPPHFAGKGRATVEKAVTELNDIVAEIDAILTNTTKAKAA
ncbi:MAG: ParA family protein [Hyphomicrobiaceae bacterium]|nr:ParA family protein [Hyphomicrobiaceae bacterium]